MGVVLGALLGLGLLLSRLANIRPLEAPLVGAFFYAKSGHSVEYLFAASITVADQATRKWGWRPSGRSAWLKADAERLRCAECPLTDRAS
jgi:hypothetical protein